ncbi:MAG: hypothetical protein RL664_1194 [Bacteroidota bacterium]
MAQDVIQFQDEVNNRIRYFQNQYVILDSDLAHFFNVETRVLNQAAQRNSKRFPTEFRFQISESDFNSLKSQIVTSKGGNRKLPWAYTEHGIAMMATLLRNDIAIVMSIEIIKAFITLRRIQTNYSSLIARIELLEEFKTESSSILKRLVSNENEVYQSKSGIFYDNEIFDAYVFSSELIAKAKKSIILIDNYIDETTLLQLSKRNKKVHCTIYTERITEQLKLDLEKHNAQYPPIEIRILKNTHDRFLILDEKELYHIGASLKDLGKRWFAFSQMNGLVNEILNHLL